tara:strand:+ start:482 stop:760 length:279 start_codon:yes stop_codon:yes gene_type:complete
MKKFMSKLKDDEEFLYHESMQNAYIILTDKLDFNELLDFNGCMLPFHPKKKIDNKVFEQLIDYFCSLEEYEKCAELKKLKESKKYKKNFINL